MNERVTVAKDESGDFSCVQDAVNALENGGEVFIKNGVYEEKIVVSADNITLIGEDRDKTILTYGDYARKLMPGGSEYGTAATYSFLAGGNGFTAKNITFVNSAGPGKFGGQALAMSTDGDRVAFFNCAFLGHQDTLFTSPRPQRNKNDPDPDEMPADTPVLRNYFKDCYIKGDVDFFFGGATAFFDNCEIYSNNREFDPNGYITAASTPKEQKWGYVFSRCRLLSDCAADSVYLGRPWRLYAHTAFICCDMGAHIKKLGWHNWTKPEAELTARYEEYGSTGAGGDMSGRAKWSKILSDEEAAQYTIENVLGDWDISSL